ncbi:MAG: hypothetical protein A2W35_16425 [Chloroflexi bacterium RBG_16_57_11]|nr:MAG: hypothetical protein A2W35_16425 [Chloroflexi bacterium RBG_16_57_11]
MIYVTKVQVVGPNSLLLTYNDGLVKPVNLRRMLWGEIFEHLRDLDYFAQVQLNEWTVYWPNGADFAPEFLYQMEPEPSPLVKA